MPTRDEPLPPADAGPVERPVRPRTCATCAHRQGWTFEFGTCGLSGYYLSTERQFPTVCGEDFKGWRQREPLLRRVQAWIYAA